MRPAHPPTDLIVRLDAETLTYLGYRENTPGTMLVAPNDFINKRMADLFPDIAVVYKAAIRKAIDSGSMQHVAYTCKGQHRTAAIVVTGKQAIVGVRAVQESTSAATG